MTPDSRVGGTMFMGTKCRWVQWGESKGSMKRGQRSAVKHLLYIKILPAQPLASPEENIREQMMGKYL